MFNRTRSPNYSMDNKELTMRIRKLEKNLETLGGQYDWLYDKCKELSERLDELIDKDDELD